MPITIDRRLIRLAIKQLLDNALKYSPPDQPVEVQVRNASDAVTVAITDHGGGISGPEQNRIFDRLYRSLNPGFTYANAAVIDVDDVLHRGTQEYHLRGGRGSNAEPF